MHWCPCTWRELVLGVADHLEQDVTTSINIANFVAAAKGFKYTFFQNLRFNPVGGVRRSFWATDHRARDGGDNSSARRDFVRINHAAVGEEGAVVAQVTAFVRVELPGGVENAFVIPNRVACPGVRRQTAASWLWFAGSPLTLWHVGRMVKADRCVRDSQRTMHYGTGISASDSRLCSTTHMLDSSLKKKGYNGVTRSHFRPHHMAWCVYLILLNL